MKNRDLYQRDPEQILLPNSGVAAMTDARTEEERRTLRFELEHFVCEGEYRKGLERILQSYLGHQDQPEQPAAWISGFFGSGKSHLAKMLRFLWTDFVFSEDGASARGLARLPNDVRDLLTELATLGRRGHGLHAAAGSLGAGAGDSVRLALLGILFKSANLPESYPQARFCLWLQRNGCYDQVSQGVAAQGRDLRSELSDLYVSPVLAKALLDADPAFAGSERDARQALREQFPRRDDITTEEFVKAMQDALANDGGMPGTAVILDEVQQYIGEDAERSYIVQEVVETCAKRFGSRVLFVGTGQTALSGTPALQRLQGRFAVNVELSDNDVETVIRRVVLTKRQDRLGDLCAALEAAAGEIDRHLHGARIAPRSEDQAVLAEDYPLLPVRRRFWEQALRAVDRAGTAGQLRTQLRIVYEAIRANADCPLGAVVPADFLFGQVAANLLNSGELLREIHETILKQDDGTPDGELKSRLCALVFLIRKLPRDPGADAGVRANLDMLADLLVQDLAQDGVALRRRLPALLDDLVDLGSLMKLGDEYSLQTREGSAWEAEFRNRRNRLLRDIPSLSGKRAQRLGEAMQQALGSIRLLQGAAKEPRKLALHFGPEPPDGGNEVALWVRDGWGADEKSALADARAAGQDSPTIHAFVPKSRADELARQIAIQSAANETLDCKGVPTTREGMEARRGMETRRAEAESRLRALVAQIIEGAKVLQGGGNELLEANLPSKVKAAAEASLVRLFPEFREADDSRWAQAIERARRGDEQPLAAVAFSGKTEEHPVCAAVLACVGSGRKGREVRAHFSAPPYGWPRDAVDAALIGLFGAGHLQATANGVALSPLSLDQGKVPATDFRVESATIDTRQRLKLRKLFQDAGIPCKPNEESAAAGKLLKMLTELAQGAGGEAPLPPVPSIRHLADLQVLAGNEQLLGVLARHEELAGNFKQWSKLRRLGKERLPAHQRLLALAEHGKALDAVQEAWPQMDAIAANRNLLADADPIPDLARAVADALRAALAEAAKRCAAVYDAQLTRLQSAESWRQIKPAERDALLRRARIEQAEVGATGTEQEVLDSLNRTSLEGWRTKTAALPQLFAEARAQADKLVEPRMRHVRLESATLRTEDDVRAWSAKTERSLLEQVKKGPIVVN